MDTFSLENLMDNVITGGEIEPQVFLCGTSYPTDCHVRLDKKDITVTTEHVMTCVEFLRNLRVTLSIGTKELNNIRHEIVSSMATGTTDRELRDIDPNYDPVLNNQLYHNLTPDFWNKDNKRIGELGTNASNMLESLKKDYAKKHVRYSPYMELCDIEQFFIFIVSREMVFSNYPLQQWHVDVLCARFRLGMDVESRISEIYGEDLFSSEEVNSRSMYVEQILKSLDLKTEALTMEDYDIEEIKEMADGNLSEEDSNRAIHILSKCFAQTKIQKKHTVQEVDDYKEGLREHDFKTRDKDNKKRVCNIPFIVAHRNNSVEYTELSCGNYLSSKAPENLKTIWAQCFEKGVMRPLQSESVEEKIEEAINPTEFNKHRIKKWHRFIPDLSTEDIQEMSLSGLMASIKENNTKSLEEHQELSHKSFDPDCETEDIEEFITGKYLTRRYKGFDFMDTNIGKLLQEAKNISMGGIKGTTPNSLEIFNKFISCSELVLFADMISCIMEELAYCNKHYNKHNSFMFRYLRYYRVGMLVHNTGTHIFVSLCFEKSASTVIDTGRLGPTIYSFGDLWISDWASFNKGTVSHMLKAGPYFASILSHLMSSFRFDPFKMEPADFFNNVENPQMWQCCKTILLTFLNGKLDLEQTLTAYRYFYVGLLDEYNPNPYRFVQRFPDVIRSRMTSYVLQRMIRFMAYYEDNKVERTISVSGTEGREQEYTNLKSVFCEGFVSMEQLIDSFYYGYVVNKERSSGPHEQFGMCKKLLKEEFKYLKMKEKGKKALDKLDEPADHRRDRSLLKFLLVTFDKISKVKIGETYKLQMKKQIFKELANTGFAKLATLKASARDHTVVSTVDYEAKDDNFKKTRKEFKQLYKDEYNRRPKMIEEISKVVDQFKDDHGNFPQELIQMLPDCLTRLEKKGYFDSDLDNKKQHGGLRETHILEEDARIIQYVVETISRTICSFYNSETITHPKRKDQFISEHYKRALITFEDFITMGKSADARTWCQNHFCQAFAIMLVSHTDKVFHNAIIRILRLWMVKRISLPMDLIETFILNAKEKKRKIDKPHDKLYKEMMDRFSNGKLPFLEVNGVKIKVTSGMFQGILHFSSSLYHVMIQEVFEHLEVSTAKMLFGMDMIVTKVEGSDDSASLNSVKVVPERVERDSRILYRFMRWKELSSEYVGVKDSDKSILAAIDFCEYNSGYNIRQKLVNPTFRWVSACMESPVIESFITRFRIMNNTLTQTLEGGASTFECALIQIAQGWYHYKLTGADSSPLYNEAVRLWILFPSPALGFFTLDPDLTCGLTGYDYSVFILARNNSRGSDVITFDDLAEVPTVDIMGMTKTEKLEYEGKKGNELSKSTGAVRLRFTEAKMWKELLARMRMPTLEECIDIIEKDPDIIFGFGKTWEEERINIALKLYSPGVKESLSSFSGALRMQVASAYMLSGKCFSVRGEPEKMSLIKALTRRANNVVSTGRDIDEIFPIADQYEEIYQFTLETTKHLFMMDADFSRRSKVKIEIFTNDLHNDIDLLNLCRRQWFKNRQAAPVSTTVFNDLWTMAKIKYKFLRDKLEETKAETGLNSLYLKYYLETIVSRRRQVALTDTSAKGSNLKTIMTRIYWPNIKILSTKLRNDEFKIESLRSTLFAVITYFFSHSHKEQVVKDLLMESSFLEDPFCLEDSRTKNLYIMRMAIDKKVSKSIIIEKLRKVRKSVLGFFSVRQKYIRGSKGRKGIGEWRGITGKTSIVINIEDKNTRLITLSSVSDLDYMGNTLRTLLNEFRCFNNEGDLSKDNVYLNKIGKLVNSILNDNNMIPVEFDTTLKINYLEQVQSHNWHIRTTPYNIRLTTGLESQETEVTLLSEPISARDWMPNLKFGYETNSLVDLFHANVSPTEEQWYEFTKVFLPSKLSERTLYYMTHDRQENMGIFNARILRELMIKSMEKQAGAKDTEIYERIMSTNKAVIEMDELDFTQDLVEELTYWEMGNAQEVAEIVSSLAAPSSNLVEIHESIKDSSGSAQWMDSTNLIHFIEEMKDSLLSNFEWKEVMETIQQGMPASNKFFISFLRYLGINFPNFNFGTIAEGTDICVTNPWGKLISIAFKRNLEDMTDEDAYEEEILSLEGSEDQGSSSAITDFSARSELAVLERIRGLEDLATHQSFATRNMAAVHLVKENRLLAKMRETRGKKNLGFMNISDIKRKDLIYEIIRVNCLIREDTLGLEDIINDELLTIGARKITVDSILQSRGRSVIASLLNNEIIDDEMSKAYEGYLVSPILTEGLIDLLCIMIACEVKFYTRDTVLYHAIPTVRIAEDGVDIELFKIKYSCETRKCVIVLEW